MTLAPEKAETSYNTLWGQMGPNCQVALYLWSALPKLYEIWLPNSLQKYKTLEKLKWHWYDLYISNISDFWSKLLPPKNKKNGNYSPLLS